MNKNQKDLIKIFIFIFILSFILINWNDVSWLFNYRAIEGLTYDFFHPYKDSKLLVSEIIMPVNVPANESNSVLAQGLKVYPYANKDNSIEIPSLSITAPIVIGQSTDNIVLSKDLDKGAVYYPGSVLPGQEGQIVILGHSSPPNWPHIKYDWVFTDINNLKMGDKVILYFNNHQYTYKVRSKIIINPGQDVQQASLSDKSNILVLVSCWPPGKDYKRIAVETELIN